MAYQVIARKWRPARFSEVVGQQHVTRTLQNAIKESRVGHAYLFVGSRGIGKTTGARIFAKALNCENPAIDAEGGTDPCCECGTCREIAHGNCLDVIEIDGASHNGVEDVRQIRDNVQYTPSSGRPYKIYIIDEVHMLSPQAWNALLKTLEEPPPHVKFFFATTEAHKILPTILSRCQRFDLKSIPVSLIVDRLRHIAEAESILIDNEALTIIARAAEGGMRDAQSIFDQMIAFCGGNDDSSRISEADVIDVFGLVSHSELIRLVAALLANDANALISAVHNLADKGRNLERLYADILLYVRNLMVFSHVSEPQKILQLNDVEFEDLRQLADAARPTVVQRLVEGLLAGDSNLRYTLNKRIYIESTLLRVMRDGHSVQIDDLITQLRALQKTGALPVLDQAAALPATPPPPAAGTPAPAAPPPQKAAAPTPTPPEPAAPTPTPAPEALPAPAPAPAPEATSAPPSAPAPPPAPPPASASASASAPAPEAAPPPAPEAASAPPAGDSNAPAFELVPDEPGGEPQAQQRTFSSPEVWEQVQKNETVQEVCDLFDGKIIDVRAVKKD